MSKQLLTPPDAVHVWRGFRNPSLSSQEYYSRLSKTFVPSTVTMQIPNKLAGYMPTFAEGVERKPDTVPDETAIVFWKSQQAYYDGFGTLAGRIYTLSHGSVFTPKPQSDASFPVSYAGTLLLDGTCFYLIDKPADWMHGQIKHLIAEVPPGAAAVAEYQKTLTEIQKRAKADGALVCVTAGYIVYWQLNGADDPGFDALVQASGWHMVREPKAYTMPEGSGLWDTWPGLDIERGDSLNMQFTRQFEQS